MKKILLFLVSTLLLVSCSKDDDAVVEKVSSTTNYTVEFLTGDLEEYVTVTLETIVNHEDGTQTIINSEYDMDNDRIAVDLPLTTESFQCIFTIETVSPVTMKFNDNTNNVTIHQELFNQQTYSYGYTF